MAAKHALWLRVILFEVMLLHWLYSPGADAGRAGAWALWTVYAAWMAAVFRLDRRGRLERRWKFGSSLVDVFAASLMIYASGSAGSDLYIAYFLVILGSCFLQNSKQSFIVGGVAAAVYAALAFPGGAALREPHYLLRLSFLMTAAFLAAQMAEDARRAEEATARRYEEELAWAQRLSLVGKALAGVVHEAKTPMNTVILTAEHAREILKTGKNADEELRIIEQEAERACAILNDFLEFARPTELALSPMPVAEVLRSVSETMRRRCEDLKIELREELEGGVVVRASRRHLVQAFTNLYMNAIQAMALGGELGVRLETRAGRAVVTVRDTGVGITPESLERLYEPFVTSRADSGGHGLGLSVTRWIVEKHGGELRVTSPGRGLGATAEVALPLFTNS